MCVLLGYGADAICPYLVFETMASLRTEGVLPGDLDDDTIYKVPCYASPTSGEAYRNRRPTTNFEL